MLFVQRDTECLQRETNMSETIEQKSIVDVRRDYELRTGKPLLIYKAYPEIGRGGVDHDQPSHAEVERMFNHALNPTFFERIWSFFRGWRFVPYAV